MTMPRRAPEPSPIHDARWLIAASLGAVFMLGWMASTVLEGWR